MLLYIRGLQIAFPVGLRRSHCSSSTLSHSAAPPTSSTEPCVRRLARSLDFLNNRRKQRPFLAGPRLFYCHDSLRGEFWCPMSSFCHCKQLISDLNLRRCFLHRSAGKNRCKSIRRAVLLCLHFSRGPDIDRSRETIAGQRRIVIGARNGSAFVFGGAALTGIRFCCGSARFD